MTCELIRMNIFTILNTYYLSEVCHVPILLSTARVIKSVLHLLTHQPTCVLTQGSTGSLKPLVSPGLLNKVVCRAVRSCKRGCFMRAIGTTQMLPCAVLSETAAQYSHQPPSGLRCSSLISRKALWSFTS